MWITRETVRFAIWESTKTLVMICLAAAGGFVVGALAFCEAR